MGGDMPHTLSSRSATFRSLNCRTLFRFSTHPHLRQYIEDIDGRIMQMLSTVLVWRRGDEKSMDEKSLFSVRHWGIGKLFLIAVACFAVAAIVFYIATWLQQFAPGSLNQNTAVQMSDEDKRRVVNSLSATASANEISPAAKLEILQSLNAN